MCWIKPSLMIANGSPLRTLKTITRPHHVPGCMQYFSSVSPLGQYTTSDFMRMAKTPILRLAPSMVPQRQ